MHWGTKHNRGLLKSVTKIGVGVLLLFLGFLPLTISSSHKQDSIFDYKIGIKLQVVSADSYTECYNRGGYWGIGGCYADSGGTKPLPEGQQGENQGFWNGLAVSISNIIYVFTVGLGGLVAYLASYFFNFAIFLSLSSTAYAQSFLIQGWGTVRDIANMAFIFILIYIAVTVMLKADTGKTMGMLARVIAIALVINFSFFFVRVVIDGGNILAVQFYNGIQANTVAQNMAAAGQSNAPPVVATLSTQAKDLTQSIMGAINVSKILDNKAFKNFSQNQQGGAGEFFNTLIALSFIYICVGVIFGLLAALFFVVGFKFISRIVILWLAIIAAPLALVMYAIPTDTTKKYANQWLSALTTYSVYPAVFLFIFFIITQFAVGLSNCKPGAVDCSILTSAFNDANASNATGLIYTANLIGAIGIRLGLIMALLYIALQVSERLSNAGGSWAQSITSRTNWMGQGLGNISRRVSTLAPRFAGNFAYRNTAGIAARGLNNTLANSSAANSWLLNNKLVGHPITSLRQGVLQPAAGVSLFGGLSRTAYDKQYKDRETERRANQWNIQNKADIKKLGDLEEKEKKGGTLSPQETQDRDRIADRVSRFGKSELESLKKGDIERIVRVLKEDQVKKLKESDKYNTGDKESFEKMWNSSSKNSPLRKANEQIKALRSIHLALKSSGAHSSVTVNEIESRIGDTNNIKHTRIDSNALADIKKGINSEMAKVRSEIKLATGPTAELQQNLQNLQEAMKSTEKLADEVKNIPQGVGGKDANNNPLSAGTFDTSQVP